MEGLFIVVIVLAIIVSSKIVSSIPDTIGNWGENCVAHELNKLPKEYVTLNNILLPARYGATQIDHIVVSRYGIFIIETKNYKGWIFGHQDSEEWTQSLLGKKRIWNWSSKQYKFRNPIRQNLAHFIAVRDILKDVGNFTIIPIVAFSNKAKLNITAPNHIIINWSDLCHVIKSHVTPSISSDNVQQIITKLSTTNNSTAGVRKQHIRQVQSIQQHWNWSIANKQCPKCGGELVEREGKYGKFWGCSNYPKCRFTHTS